MSLGHASHASARGSLAGIDHDAQKEGTASRRGEREPLAFGPVHLARERLVVMECTAEFAPRGRHDLPSHARGGLVVVERLGGRHGLAFGREPVVAKLRPSSRLR